MIFRRGEASQRNRSCLEVVWEDGKLYASLKRERKNAILPADTQEADVFASVWCFAHMHYHFRQTVSLPFRGVFRGAWGHSIIAPWSQWTEIFPVEFQISPPEPHKKGKFRWSYAISPSDGKFSPFEPVLSLHSVGHLKHASPDFGPVALGDWHKLYEGLDFSDIVRLHTTYWTFSWDIRFWRSHREEVDTLWDTFPWDSLHAVAALWGMWLAFQCDDRAKIERVTREHPGTWQRMCCLSRVEWAAHTKKLEETRNAFPQTDARSMFDMATTYYKKEEEVRWQMEVVGETDE